MASEKVCRDHFSIGLCECRIADREAANSKPDPEIDFEGMAREVAERILHDGLGFSPSERERRDTESEIASALRGGDAAQARRDAEIALREAEEWGNPEATEYQSAMRIAAAIRKEMGL